MRHSTERNEMVRWAALGGVVGPLVFVTLVIVGGVIYDGYSHASQKISELGGEGAEHAIVQNLNFAVLGVLVLGFAWALANTFGPPHVGALLIGFFGLILLVHSVVHCDEGCEGETTVGLLHNVTGIAGFVAALTGMVMLARRWRPDPAWRSHADFTLGIFVVALAGLVWFVATQATDSESLAGIAQRVFAGALLLWIAVTAARLVVELHSRPTEPENRPDESQHGAELSRT